MSTITDWMTEAACAGHDAFTNPDLDYDPSLGASIHDDLDLENITDAADTDGDNEGAAERDRLLVQKLTAEAACKQVCQQCPVREQCLADALRTEVWGVAGGLNEDERVEMRHTLGVAINVIDLRAYIAPDTAPTRVPTPAAAPDAPTAIATLKPGNQPSTPKPTNDALTTERPAGRTARVTHRPVLDLPQEVIDRPLLQGRAPDKPSSGRTHVGSVVWDTLTAAITTGSNGGWVDAETVIAAVESSGALSDDEAYYEFARDTRTGSRIRSGASSSPLTERLRTGRRLIVLNLLQCAVRKGQMERYETGSRSAPHFRLTAAQAAAWAAVEPQSTPRRYLVREPSREIQAARTRLANIERRLSSARAASARAMKQWSDLTDHETHHDPQPALFALTTGSHPGTRIMAEPENALAAETLEKLRTARDTEHTLLEQHEAAQVALENAWSTYRARIAMAKTVIEVPPTDRLDLALVEQIHALIGVSA